MLNLTLRTGRTACNPLALTARGPLPTSAAFVPVLVRLPCCWSSTYSTRLHRGPQRSAAAPAAIDQVTATPPAEDDQQAGQLYGRPDLYDAAFSYRDFQQEVSFIKAAYKKYAGGQKLHTALELGCGPARHSIALAKGGVQVTALDLNPAMLAYAKTRAQAAALKPEQFTAVEGDMCNLQLEAGSYDLVMCLIGTFSHLLDNTSALKCFQQVQKVLRPGGLFLLELAHPGDLFDGTLIVGDGGQESWETPYGDAKVGRKLLTQWGAELDDFDPVTQILYRTVAINVLDKKGNVEEAVEEVVPYRQYTLQEINLLASIVGLTVEGVFGEMNLGVDLRHEEAYRMVIALKKPAEL